MTLPPVRMVAITEVHGNQPKVIVCNSGMGESVSNPRYPFCYFETRVLQRNDGCSFVV